MIAHKIAAHDRLLPIHCCLKLLPGGFLGGLADRRVSGARSVSIPELDAARRRPGRFQHRRFGVVGPRLSRLI